MASNTFSNKVNLSGPNPKNLGAGLSFGSTGNIKGGSLLSNTPVSTALSNILSGNKTATPATSASIRQRVFGTQPTSTVKTQTIQPAQQTQQPAQQQPAIQISNPVSSTGVKVGDIAPGTQSVSQDIINRDNQPKYQSTNSGLYSQLVADLANRASKGNENVQRATTDLQGFKQDVAQKNANIVGTGADLSFKQGQQGALQNLSAVGVQSREQALANALKSQELEQQGLQQAANLAAPQLGGFNQQVFNPITSQFGGNVGINEAVSNIAQKVINGQISYNDAVSSLSGYGQGGVNALQQALPQNFNIAQSNALAGQQGTIGVNYQLADTALKNVENILSQLPATQSTNVPILNQIGRAFSTQTGIGSEQSRAFTGAVASLRNAYASLLASSRGGTPTDYSSQAIAEIPDNPTPNDIAAIRKNMETLGRARTQILGNPGQASISQSSGTTNFNW